MHRVSSVRMPMRFEASARFGSSGRGMRSTTRTLIRLGSLTPAVTASARCREHSGLPCFRTNSSCLFAHRTAIGSNFSNVFGSTTAMGTSNRAQAVRAGGYAPKNAPDYKSVSFNSLERLVLAKTPLSAGNLLGMEFVPVADRSADCHVAWISGLVQSDK